MAKLAGILEVILVLNYGLIFAESSGVPAKPTNLSVVKQQPSADHGIIATLTWSVSPSNRPLSYYVRYREESKQDHTQKMTEETSARIFLKPNSYYIVKVMAIDAQSPGKWSDDLKVRTSDSVPTHAPDNVTATAVTSSASILVRWQAIPQNDRNGKLLGYVVFYRKQSTRRWNLKKLTNPVAFQYQVNGLSMGESYLIAVAGHTKKGVGKKSDSVTVHLQTTTVDLPATTPTTSTVAQQTTAFPSTAEVYSTPKYVYNHVPKPTRIIDKVVTYERPSRPHTVYDISQTTVISPDAQANKDVPEQKSSSVDVVYKFILPAAIGGLVMVILIVCLMWRHRKSKRKHSHGDESISLTPLDETRKKEKTRCVVSRGEGSIRYAPPPKTYTESAPPSQDADPEDVTQSDETRTKLSVISECEPVSNATRALPSKPRQPYAEVSIVDNDKDERYVKRNGHKPVPSSPCKSTTSEAGYENMQPLYECPDGKYNNKSPLYMNVGTAVQDEDGIYEEIPADRKNKDEPTVSQPLLDKNVNEQVKPESA